MSKKIPAFTNPPLPFQIDISNKQVKYREKEIYLYKFTKTEQESYMSFFTSLSSNRLPIKRLVA